MPLLGTWIRPIALVLAAASMLHGQDADLAERLFRSGERAYAAHNYPEALDTWNQVIAQTPQSPFAAQALLTLAKYQMEVEKKPQAAISYLEKLKTEHLKTSYAGTALLMLGNIRASSARTPAEIKEAMGDFNRVADLFPDHPAVQEARYQMGEGYKLLGQWSRALQSFSEAMRLDPASSMAHMAQLQAAETLDIMGDLTGCLRMLQDLRNRYPAAPEAVDAKWRIQVRVQQRLLKPALRSDGSWPAGKPQKWVNTPILLAMGPEGDLYIFQGDDDKAYHLTKDGALEPSGPIVKAAKALLVPSPGTTWVVSGKFGLIKEDGLQGAPPLPSPSGGMQDLWGNVWICDPGSSFIQVTGSPTPLTLPVAGVQALAPLPTGGAVAASDDQRTLRYLDATGKVITTIPYGKDLPASFKYVVALTSDPLGHVAALVDGDFEGVVLWGPNGEVLRQATYKNLGINGKFRAVALDRQGGIIIADRSNDLLIRLQ